MGIDATTFEEMSLNNVNEKTAVIASKAGSYLLETWGIIKLTLVVDGKKYEQSMGEDHDNDHISKDTQLYDVCRNLASCGSFTYSMNSNNGWGLEGRTDEFIDSLTDDPDLCKNITYKSIDYYDTDDYVDICLYKDGFKSVSCKPYDNKTNYELEDLYDGTLSCIEDISSWYCYTPSVSFTTDDMQNNEELYNVLTENLNMLENNCFRYASFDDGWKDYGEIVLEGSLAFDTASIPAIFDGFSKIVAKMKQFDQDGIEIIISAVPDGPDDYWFANVRFEYKNGEFKLSCYRI